MMERRLGIGDGGAARWSTVLLMWLILSATGAVRPVLAAEEPAIAAGNAVVLTDTGVLLFDRGGRERVAPASLTKIMTAHVALQRGDLAQRITVEADDLVGQASMGLRLGEAVPLETLLYGLLLPSGNDAAMTIARGLGARPGDASGAEGVARFVGWMNEEAVRLGLRETHFVNPHGLDAPGHLASAYDLARLTLTAWADPRFADIAGSPSYAGHGYWVAHGHRLVGVHPSVAGGKTGRTRGCRSCLLTMAERDGRRLVVVVLRDARETVLASTATLLEWSLGQPVTTPTPTPPPTPTPTSTRTPTATPLATSTSTPTPLPTASPTPSATPIALPSPTSPPAGVGRAAAVLIDGDGMTASEPGWAWPLLSGVMLLAAIGGLRGWRRRRDGD